MRIRKNSKLIHGGNTSVSSSSSPSSFLICQLNRSPWDVLDVFSLQGECDAGFESIPASDSVRSGESMELSFEYVEKPPVPATTATNDRENGSIVEFEAIKTPPIFHHISASPPPPLPPKKAATTTPKRRGRPKKPATPAATATATANNNNPHEFYYYSGFGPSWAKRRGGDRPFDDGSNSKNKKIKEKKKEKEKKEDDNGVDMVDEELDYIDDDDDDDEDEEEDLYGGSKRARKPIKARSLKSLM